MEIVHADLSVVVVAPVTEGVDGGDVDAAGILCNCGDAPSVVGIPGNRFVCSAAFAVFVYDRDDVALQVPAEIERCAVVDDAADAVFVVVQRNQRVVAPGLAEDCGTVKRVGVLDAAYRLAGADAVGVVGVGVAVEALELAAFFPCERVAEIRGRVALRVIGDGLPVKRGEQVFPNAVAIGIRGFAVFVDLAGLAAYPLGGDVAVAVIFEFGLDAVDGFAGQLSLRVIGIGGDAGNAVNAVGDLRDALFGVVLIGEGAAVGEEDGFDKLGSGGGFQFSIFKVLGGLGAYVFFE